MIILARQMARLLGGVAAVIVMILAVLGPAPAYAVHDTNTFELEGNVADNSAAGAPDDWQSVRSGVNALPSCSTSPPPCLIAKTMGTPTTPTNLEIRDPAPLSIFTGGGSKDDLDIPKWKWKNGSVPDKDNITNAYAAAYNVGGELVVYFGADRFDNSGDANMGFWFFQQNVTPKDLTGQSAGFNGTHTVGDLLILATFTGGGTTVGIQVLEWVGSGGNEGGGTLQIIGTVNQAKCGVSGSDDFCAITNPAAGETPPWPYLSKDNTTSFPQATFFEGGINVSDVFRGLGTGIPCFSSFMAETRSSSSVNAVLKDFVLGAFPVCGVEVTKDCTTPELIGNQIKYTIRGKVTNTGFGTLSNIQLVDVPATTNPIGFVTCPPITPEVAVPAPASLTAGQEVCYKGDFLSATNAPQDTVTVTASTGGGASVTDSATDTCPQLSLSPLISVSKTCETSLVAEGGVVKVKVTISGDVCNTGDTPLTNVTVTDTDAGGGNPLTLSPAGTTLPVAPVNGTSCKTFSTFYFPSSFDPVDPGLAHFSDTVTAEGTPPAITGSGPVSATDTAHCFLCPVPEN